MEDKLKELLYDIDKNRNNLGSVHGIIMQYAELVQAKAWAERVEKAIEVSKKADYMLSITKYSSRDKLIEMLNELRSISDFASDYYAYNESSHGGRDHISIPKTGIMFSFVDGELVCMQQYLKQDFFHIFEKYEKK